MARSTREILNSLVKKVPPRLVFPNDNDRYPAIEFPSPATEQGPLGRLGVYHIQQEVGSGTYGVVLEAYEEKLDRFVALKVLRPHLGGTARKSQAIREKHPPPRSRIPMLL